MRKSYEIVITETENRSGPFRGAIIRNGRTRTNARSIDDAIASVRDLLEFLEALEEEESSGPPAVAEAVSE